MANPHRATVTVDLGEPPVAHDLCLNTGALAEFEAEFNVNSLDYLPSRATPDSPMLPPARSLNVRESMAVIRLGLKGAGKSVGAAAVQSLLDAMGPLRFVMAAYTALVGAFQSPDSEPKGNPPRGGESPSA